MATARLKVSVNELKAEAQTIANQIASIEKNWKGLCEVIESSKNYWEGEASERHRTILSNEKADMEHVIKKLNEHPKDLYAMAGVYKDAELKAKELANTLPTDVIV